MDNRHNNAETPRNTRRDADFDREREERITLSEEELAIGKRQHAAGEVVVEKDIETEHVREQIPVTRERVTVERHAVEPGMRAEGRIEEDTVRIPLTEEQIVAEKRVVPKEELVLKKNQVEDREVVEADLRRERAEIHREGEVRERR